MDAVRFLGNLLERWQLPFHYPTRTQDLSAVVRFFHGTTLSEIRLPLEREKAAGTIVGPGVQVTSRGGDAGMSESGLYQMNGRSTVESV